MKKALALAAIAIGLLSMSPDAIAADYEFFLSADQGPGAEYDFILPSDPTPDAFSADGFSIFNVPNAHGGSPAPPSGFFFATTAAGGGIRTDLDQSYLGSQLFSGPTSHPHFLAGFYDVAYPTIRGTYSGTIEIRENAASSAAPEPASWALLILGFGGIGLAMRGRGHGRRDSLKPCSR